MSSLLEEKGDDHSERVGYYSNALCKKVSQRKIAKLLGVSRNTVKQAIQNQHVLKYHRNQPNKSQLEAFKEQIEQMLFVEQFFGSVSVWETASFAPAR